MACMGHSFDCPIHLTDEYDPIWANYGFFGAFENRKGKPVTKHALIPPQVQAAAEALQMSPGIVSGNLIFLTGTTGSGPDGQMPASAEAQFHAAFEKIGFVLGHAGVDLNAVVEMTSYHVGLRDHFDLFDKVRREVFAAPYPAWTAVEVAGIRRPGAVVEIRIIASLEG
ncbi:hypothetical protein GCM10007928_20250 [Sulfitobacter porphyrae]|nr:hypothetical protein GCM10007928_20250 [Sulfitobacter porphyrae]